jgi:hypothetical protein
MRQREAVWNEVWVGILQLKEIRVQSVEVEYNWL